MTSQISSNRIKKANMTNLSLTWTEDTINNEKMGRKKVKILKKLILNNEQNSEHLFAGLKTQRAGPSCWKKHDSWTCVTKGWEPLL